MKYTGKSNELLHLAEPNTFDPSVVSNTDHDSMVFIWCIEGITEINVDGQLIAVKQDQIISLTGEHTILLKKNNARIIRFNRPFYCVIDHDDEVGCKGILFYGSSQPPLIDIPKEDQEKFDTLWKMFSLEMKIHDTIQAEMLQMMLKRFIILCTRLAKLQSRLINLKTGQIDLIREFNYLVEKYFREKHSVYEYAELLHKSPKTLANLFSKYSNRTPVQLIHDRIHMEAKRMLVYTDLSVKEIGYYLGFDDIQSFSRFFKKGVGESPLEFKESIMGPKKGRIDKR